MKKRLIRRFRDEMFPNRVERFLAPIKTRLDSMVSIVETEVIKANYQELPYSISKKIVRYATPNRTFYESHLEGITSPVYRNRDINTMVRRVTNDLIYSACGIGISNPESSMIVVSIDGVPTDEPEPFDIFYDMQKKKQSPRISEKEEQGATELVVKTEKIYDFFKKYRKGFEKALCIIDKEYPCIGEEWEVLMDYISDECKLDFIRLQQRQRICTNTPKRMEEIMLRVYGPNFLLDKS